jgi:hypothetical protein
MLSDTCVTLRLEKLTAHQSNIKYLPYMPFMKCLEIGSNKIRKLPVLPTDIECLFIRYKNKKYKISTRL